MTVAELIAELSKLDQTAVVCTRQDDADPAETDNRVRIIGGWSADRRAGFVDEPESDLAELRPLDAPEDPEDFAVVLIG